MKIGLAADHRGYKLKEKLKVFLQEKGYEIVDVGTFNFERTDFPLLAEKLCKKLKENVVSYGIAICGTGIGMSIACNKIHGIYCAKVDSIKDAKMAKEHNNCNVISIKGKMCSLKAKTIVSKFLKTDFNTDDEKYKERFDQIIKIESK